jgi:CMP-N,N'-diacetyllegionaminic acid synthase
VRMVALIPARAGSKRIPGKNMKLLAGHPLIVYTISAAIESGVFSDVVVCSDDDRVFIYTSTSGRDWPVSYVSRAPVSDTQPDIEWVREVIQKVWTARQERPDAFAILRPTSPFRTAETIRRAYQQFTAMAARFDSLRAVEPARQTPYKMWSLQGRGMFPLFHGTRADGTPFHSCPTQTLPPVYVQNASLEMSWTRNVTEHQSISCTAIAPFFTQGYEGFDINEPRDWREAEYLIASGEAQLPEISLTLERSEG